MPNTDSARKEFRKSTKRRLQNRSQRSTLRTSVKRVRDAVVEGNKEGAQTAFQQATKKLDQAADKNLIHKNTAARTKSRLSRLIKGKFAAVKK